MPGLGLGLGLGRQGGGVLAPPEAPVAGTATSVLDTSFTANWAASEGATGYKLDVSTVSNFSSFVSGYEDKTVSGTSQSVTELTAGTTYYYRVRAVNAGGASENSGPISQATYPSLANLAFWIDAAETPFSVVGGVIAEIKCKKTGKSLTQATETMRPAYDAANKKIVFTQANKQHLASATFFTTEPFKSATKGMGQAFTIIYVGNYGLGLGISSQNQGSGLYPSTTTVAIRSGGSAGAGGQLTISHNDTKRVTGVIKPVNSEDMGALNPDLCALGTFNTTLASCAPVPILYFNGTKQTSISSVTQATSNGPAFNVGALHYGIWAYSGGESGYAMRGDSYEVMLFDTAITEERLQAIISYLQAKWSIA